MTWNQLALVIGLTILSTKAIAQTVSWAKTLAYPANSEVTAMTTDQAGFLYVAGRTGPQQPNTFLGNYAVGNIFLNKYDSLGNMLWSRTFTGEGRAFDLEADGANNLLMCGVFLSSLAFDSDTLYNLPVSFPRNGSYLAKLDSAGRLMWVKHAVWHAQDQGMVALATDSQQNIYVAGLGTDVEGLFAKYNAAGTLQWEKTIAGVRTFSDVAVDANDQPVVSGTCNPGTVFDTIAPVYDPAGGYFNFLLRCNAQGITQWADINPYITFDFGSGVAIRGNSVFWHYNSTDNHSTFDNYLTHYPAGGSLAHVHSDAEHSNGFYPVSLASAPDGSIYWTRNNGEFSALPVNFLLQRIAPGATAAAPYFQATGLGLEGTALAASGNSVYVGGKFRQQTLDFGAVQLVNQHNAGAWETQVFIARIGSLPLAFGAEPFSRPVQLYPNPTAGKFVISLPAGSSASAIQILDHTGRLLHNQTWPDGARQIEVDAPLPTGFYLVQLHTASGRQTHKLLIGR